MTDTITTSIPTVRPNARYGWLPDLPDNRDIQWKPPKTRRLAAQRLPTKKDLRLLPYEPLPYDQDYLGSCTGNGVAGAFEFVNRKQGLADYIPSRLFIYYEERRIINSIPYDSGAFIRDGLKVVNKLGAPHESMWPYNINAFAQEPYPGVYDDAALHQTIQYAFVDNRIQTPVKQAIAAENPVIIGFTVYPWFEDVRSNGVCTPVAGQPVLGGHCVEIVGYETSRPMFGNSKVYAIIRNSWGTGWGEGGYCYMPLSWLCNYDNADDFWVISMVES